MAGVLEQLNEIILPSIFGSLQNVGIVDTMTIYERTQTRDAAGGVVKSAGVAAYEAIPVSYEPVQFKTQFDANGKVLSSQQYKLTCPITYNDIRLDIDASKHYFVVDARGYEPAKTFRPFTIRDDSGVVFEIIAERENAE